MREEYGLGGKKINRVNVSLTNYDIRKLNELAKSVNMRPTTLAGWLIENCLNDSQFVNDLQNEFTTNNAYRVRIVSNDRKKVYDVGSRID